VQMPKIFADNLIGNCKHDAGEWYLKRQLGLMPQHGAALISYDGLAPQNVVADIMGDEEGNLPEGSRVYFNALVLRSAPLGLELARLHYKRQFVAPEDLPILDMQIDNLAFLILSRTEDFTEQAKGPHVSAIKPLKSENWKKIGERVFKLRNEAKPRVSIRKLAAMIKVSPSTICRVENGNFQPSTTTLRRLAYALGVTIDELVLGLKGESR
jgi:DNA-binding XRE family transcriptional regulator